MWDMAEGTEAGAGAEAAVLEEPPTLEALAVPVDPPCLGHASKGAGRLRGFHTQPGAFDISRRSKAEGGSGGGVVAAFVNDYRYWGNQCPPCPSTTSGGQTMDWLRERFGEASFWDSGSWHGGDWGDKAGHLGGCHCYQPNCQQSLQGTSA